MKILFISRRFYPEFVGGGQISGFYIAKAVKAQGHDVLVCSFTNEKKGRKIVIEGIPIYFLPIRTIKFLPRFSNLEFMYYEMARLCKSVIKKFKPDILHSLNQESMPSVSYLSWKHKVPFVGTQNGPWLFCFTGEAIDYKQQSCNKCKPLKMYRCILKTWFEKDKMKHFKCFFYWTYAVLHTKFLTHMSKRADLLFPVSRAIRKFMINTGYSSKNIRIIHNPIKIQKKIKSNIKEVLGLENKNIVTYAGRISESKGLYEIIQAMTKVHNAVFLVIGPNNAYVEELKQIIKNLDIEDRVKFVGYVDNRELIKYYSVTDLIVFPCKIYEALPRMLIEACSFGIPIIASNIAGNKDIVDDNKNGMLLKTSDVEELSEKMNEILMNKELAKKLGDNGIKKSQENFSIDIVGKKYVEAYEEVLKNK